MATLESFIHCLKSQKHLVGHNKQNHTKVGCFHFNGHTIGLPLVCRQNGKITVTVQGPRLFKPSFTLKKNKLEPRTKLICLPYWFIHRERDVHPTPQINFLTFFFTFHVQHSKTKFLQFYGWRACRFWSVSQSITWKRTVSSWE